MAHLPNHDAELEACINECLTCYRVCLETIQHCLIKGGEHASAEHIRLLTNCADICQTSARFMLSGSDFHVQTCSVCAEVCDACAKSCEQMGDDESMKICAEACRRCADSCRKMGYSAAA